jgi:hypothetical protein
MGTPLSSVKPKMKELQMDWLRSEDLKEEKVVTTPLPIVAVEVIQIKKVEPRCSLVVENNVEQRTVDFKLTVVANEAQLPKSIHEEANPRASCAHHLC